MPEFLFGNLVPPGTLTAADSPRFSERTLDQQARHDTIVATILGDYATKAPSYATRPLNDGDAIEWDKLIDKNAPGSFVGQVTGSCVGANGINVMLIQIAVENLIKRTGEALHTDWHWLKPYGDSRDYAGFDDEGDGSYESVYCEALLKRGIPRIDQSSDFPRWESREGCRWWTEKQEFHWSSRRNYGSKYDDLSDDHLLLDGAMIPIQNWQDSMQQMLHALQGGPVGLASMLGYDKIEQKNGFKLFRWDARWAHKQGVCGVAKDAQLGTLFKMMNRSWGSSQYASGWLPESEMVRVHKDRGTEIMVVRDFAGVKDADDIQWLIDLIMSL